MPKPKKTLWLDSSIFPSLLSLGQDKAELIISELRKLYDLRMTDAVYQEISNSNDLPEKKALMRVGDIKPEQTQEGKKWVAGTKNAGEKSIIEVFDRDKLWNKNHYIATNDDKFLSNSGLSNRQNQLLGTADLAGELLQQGGKFTPELYSALRRIRTRHVRNTFGWYNDEEARAVYESGRLILSPAQEARVVFKTIHTAVGALGKGINHATISRSGLSVTAEIYTPEETLNPLGKIADAPAMLVHSPEGITIPVTAQIDGASAVIGLTLHRDVPRR